MSLLIIPFQTLSSLWHLRSNGHASQSVSRKWYSPTQITRIRQRTWIRGTSQQRVSHREANLLSISSRNQLLPQILHCRACDFTLHIRSIRQQRHINHSRRLPLRHQRRRSRSLRHLRPFILEHFPRRRHDLRISASPFGHQCRNRMHDSRADGIGGCSELDDPALAATTYYEKY